MRTVRKIALLGALTGTSFGLGMVAPGMWTTHRVSAGVAQHAVAMAAEPPAEVARQEPALETRHGLPSFASLVEAVSPAVIHVKVVSTVKAAAIGDGSPFGEDGPFRGFRSPMPPPAGRTQGTGSGFIIQKDGVVLTNNHVVENAKEITVRLSDGTEFPAKVLGRDPKTDLAVLKIEAQHSLPIVRLGDSDALRVGDWVVAIGNPFGLDNTVTAGIVSAKGRAIGSGPYDQFIQTDAPINPGNSGGPLFNERGDVIGINSAIFSRSGGNVGIGFAIPINMAKELAPQLEEHGHVTRAWLGVSIQQLTPQLAESLGLDDTHGALVAGVTPDGPAAKAGIKTGDVIATFNDKPIDTHNGLPALVAAGKVGETVGVDVIRDGKRKTLDVTLAKLADDDVAEATTPSKGKWGLMLRELTPEERAQREIADGQGVLVTGVAPDSPAEEAGLHRGDIVLQVNRKSVGSVEGLRAEVAKVADGKHLVLLVRPADGNDHFAALAPR